MEDRLSLALAIHGGAWNVPDGDVAAHRDGVAAALTAGWERLLDGDSALGDRPMRAAGREDRESLFDESPSELDDARLVRDRYQRAFDLCHAPTFEGRAIPRAQNAVNGF